MVDAEVLAAVPHRAPMLRVHRVVAANGTDAVVVGREPEGAGALPWALGAIEGLAQSAAVLLGAAVPAAARAVAAPRGMLVAVKRFAVTAEPPPGTEITYHVHLVRRLGTTVLVSGHAEAGGRRLAAGDLALWTAPN